MLIMGNASANANAEVLSNQRIEQDMRDGILPPTGWAARNGCYKPRQKRKRAKRRQREAKPDLSGETRVPEAGWAAERIATAHALHDAGKLSDTEHRQCLAAVLSADWLAIRTALRGALVNRHRATTPERVQDASVILWRRLLTGLPLAVAISRAVSDVAYGRVGEDGWTYRHRYVADQPCESIDVDKLPGRSGVRVCQLCSDAVTAGLVCSGCERELQGECEAPPADVLDDLAPALAGESVADLIDAACRAVAVDPRDVRSVADLLPC